MIFDAIATIGGMILPPAFDFLKKKFIKKEQDSPEQTINSLATTKPEVLPQYTQALTGFQESKIRFFNRDVIGTPSMWVVNLRASIRPITVCLCMLLLIGMLGGAMTGHIDTVEMNSLVGIRLSAESIVGNWFGAQFTTKANMQ